MTHRERCPQPAGGIRRGTAMAALALAAMLAASPGWAACSTNAPSDNQTVTCTGIDTTGVNGSGRSSITVDNTGTITKDVAPAIQLGTSGTLTNSGTVTSNGFADQFSAFTIVAGDKSTITNNGTISNTNGLEAIFLLQGGTISITNSGTMTAASASVIGGGPNTNSDTTVRNNGTMVGLRGLSLKGDSILIVNRGRIEGRGTEEGRSEGVLLDGSKNRVQNFGTIAGGSGVAVNFRGSGGGNTLLIGAGSVLIGNAVASGANNTLSLAGDADSSDSLDVGTLGAQGSSKKYQGFDVFTKEGGGTWTLTGTESGTRAWTIDAGTLVVDTNSLKGNVTNNGALRFDQAGNGSHDAVISGSGTLTKVGVGGVTLNGVNTYTGLTTITGGTLTIGDAGHSGARIPGSVTVDGAGTLSGFGTIGGTVMNNGTVHPGGSIGTLTVGGAYTQSATGTLAVEVAGLSLPFFVPQASLLSVGGAASLTGSLAVTVNPGVYFFGSRYTIVSAGGGVTGTFAQTTGTDISPFLFLSPIYQPNAVLLEVRPRPIGFTDVVTDPEQRTAAALLDALARAAPPSSANTGNALARDIAALESIPTVAQLEQVLDQLFGSVEIYGGLASAAMRQSYIVATTVGEQMRRTRGADGSIVQADGAGPGRIQLAARDGGGTTPVGAWMSGYGEFGKVGGAATAHTLSFSTGGMLLGGDVQAAPGVLLGGFGGYGGTGMGLQRLDASGTIDSYAFGGYGSWSAGRLYVDGLTAYIYNEERTRRALPIPFLPTRTAFGDTHAHQFLGSLEVGYSIAPPGTERLNVTPFVGFQGTTLSQAPLTERGAEELSLAVNALDAASARALLGLRLDQGIVLGEGAAATASLKLGWARELVDTERIVTGSLPVLPGSSIALQAARPRRDSALVGAGMAGRIDGGVSAFVRYDGDLNGVDDSHAVIAGVRLTW